MFILNNSYEYFICKFRIFLKKIDLKNVGLYYYVNIGLKYFSQNMLSSKNHPENMDPYNV